MSGEMLETALCADGDQVVEMQTRFLYPFYFRRQSQRDARHLLDTARFETRKGQSIPIWECCTADRSYTDELLEHAKELLFGDSSQSGCAYFKINHILADMWLRRTDAELGKLTLPFEVASGRLIELFLSTQGVGVLSVALAMHPKDPEDLVEFNYRLAQFRRHDHVQIRKRAAALEQPASDAPQQMAAPVKADGPLPLGDRLGNRGEAFSLPEFVRFLLEPLGSLGLREIQKEFLVFTAVRFRPTADFASEKARDAYSVLLSRLTQIEEAKHPGAVPGMVSVPNGVLNRCHWAAVGLLGSAHLLLDQSTESNRVEFDSQRMPIVQDKYFVQFLLALLQRLTLNRAIDDLSRMGDFRAGQADDQLVELRAHLLDFSAKGQFAQTSVRQVLHQYYQLARAGLDVPSAWSEVQHAIADLDAVRAVKRQEQLVLQQSELSERMNENLTEVRHVQKFLHMIEYFLVSVYCAHLAHMVVEGPYHEYPWFISQVVIAAALFGLALACFIDYFPWFKKRNHDETADDK